VTTLIGDERWALRVSTSGGSMVMIATLTVFFVANSGRSAWYLGVMLLVVCATFGMTLYLLQPAS
jgi:Ca2+:H+ antiporter